MNKVFFSLILVFYASCFSTVIDDIINIKNYNTEQKLKEREWECFILALTWMESRHDTLAKNPKSSALGLFQQLYVYVDDCNRILGYKKYSYKDRTCPIKSREMFDIIQGHYNPQRDLDRAINLHSGYTASNKYKSLLYLKMLEYVEQTKQSSILFSKD